VKNRNVTKPSAEARATAKSDYMVIVSKNEFEHLIGKLDFIFERFDGLVTELEMTNHIFRIQIELVGGVDPGRKNLTSLGSTIAYTYGMRTGRTSSPPTMERPSLMTPSGTHEPERNGILLHEERLGGTSLGLLTARRTRW